MCVLLDPYHIHNAQHPQGGERVPVQRLSQGVVGKQFHEVPVEIWPALHTCPHHKQMDRTRCRGVQGHSSTPLPRQHFPVHMVPTRPFRFRDNLVGQGFALQHLSAVQSFFEKLYTLKLQEEGVGAHLPTLEAMLHTHPLSGHIDISMKNKLQDQHTLSPGQQLIWYPDVHSPNARATLQSLVPTLAKKCVQYSTTGDLFTRNATTVHTELAAKGYPRSWWENKLKLHLLHHTRNTPCEYLMPQGRGEPLTPCPCSQPYKHHDRFLNV